MPNKKKPPSQPNDGQDKTRIARRGSAPLAPAEAVPSGRSPAFDEATVFLPRKSRQAPETEGSRVLVDAATSDAGQYTEYRSASASHSSGFLKASELAKKALNGSGAGMLLKKRFLLEETLGQGGMGTVYKARDLRKVEAEDPNPYIAVKVLNQDFKDHPDAFVTLQQETAKSQALAHPNIVTVHDFDRDGDILFMTMELLQGEPLDKLIRSGAGLSLAKDEALSLIRDLCAALSHAHRRQLVHADFKPGNAFVSKDGTAKVLDFGIARAVSKEAHDHKFDAGQLGALTPAYATIEMMNDEPISFADDVYALACVAYEMLSGEHPYGGVSAKEACEKRLKPKRLEALTARQWKALSRGLELQKQNRTATIDAFAAELFPRRRPLALKVAAVLLPVSFAGVGWFAYNDHQSEARIAHTIESNIQEAKACFAAAKYECAIEHSLVVRNIDSTNEVATTLLENAQLALRNQQHLANVQKLLADAEKCSKDGDFACAQVKARELLDIDSGNQRGQALLQDSMQSLQIAQLVDKGEACLREENLGCAKEALTSALAVDASHSATLRLHSSVIAAEADALEKQRQVDKHLADARKCLLQKQYKCSIENAGLARSLSADNAEAVEIIKSAELAQQQDVEMERQVRAILEQASACEAKKNYSCAIAKAEAALHIKPNHVRATQIRQRAQRIQQQLKTTGFTIQ